MTAAPAASVALRELRIWLHAPTPCGTGGFISTTRGHRCEVQVKVRVLWGPLHDQAAGEFEERQAQLLGQGLPLRPGVQHVSRAARLN